MKGVKVAVLAALCGVSAAPCSMSTAPHGVLVALHGVLAAQDTHGQLQGGLRDPQRGGGTIHDNF